VTTGSPNDWSQTLRNRTRLSYGQDGPCFITLLDEDVSERPVARHWIVTRCDEDLDADVISTRIEVRSQSGTNVLRLAVEHEGVNQAVASPVAHVLDSKAVALQVVDIVAKPEVRLLDEGAADGSGLVCVWAHHRLVLGREQGLTPEELAGVAGKVGHHEVRVRPRRPLGCEPQRARTKRGEDATVPRHSAGIQFVEVRGHRIARVLYVAIDSGWPMPTPSKNRLGCLLVLRW